MRYVSQIYGFDLSPVVKTLIIINGLSWFFLVVFLQGLFLDQPYVFMYLGLIPNQVVDQFWLWQTLTYMFVHSENIFHILFNMFALWMFGSELERFWGAKFFLLYYLVCGIGVAVIYILSLQLIPLFYDLNPLHANVPLIGASGAIFGILFAYGLIYSERVILFMMVFPMKAIHFTLLIGMIEFVSLVNNGMGSSVSHLSHLSGFVVGFLFLQLWKNIQNFKIRRFRRGSTSFRVLKN